MTPKQKTMAWLGGGVALMVIGTLVMFVLAKSCTFDPPPPLVPSKETTWFTGPVRADGGIDWPAALEAEARANGLKDEENGAPLLKEALEGFLGLEEWVEKSGTKIDGEVDEELERASAALGRGELDAPNVGALLAWIEACGPALEKARQAAERKDYFLVTRDRSLDFWPTDDELPELDELLRALRLRIAARAARAEVDGALADAATACVLARATASPPSLAEQSFALAREVDVLEQLVRCVQGDRALPADRLFAVVEARPFRWTGDGALREAMRGARLVATSYLDALRCFRGKVSPNSIDPHDPALLRVDLNPLFRRLQQVFDDLESSLLDSNRLPGDRIDAWVAQSESLVDSGNAAWKRSREKLRSVLDSDERLAASVLDRVLQYPAAVMSEELPEWLALTARRDALLAELAARAGAPERRDSWLGEPLVVTRNKDDGSIEVGGALIDLAREHGADLDEEDEE